LQQVDGFLRVLPPSWKNRALGPYLHKPLTGITFVNKMVVKIKTIFIVLVLPINSVFKHWLQNIILKNVGLTQKVIGNF
jgi:hypothetical protein